MEERIKDKTRIIEEQRLTIYSQKREIEIKNNELYDHKKKIEDQMIELDNKNKEINILSHKIIKYIKLINNMNEERSDMINKKQLDDVVDKYKSILSQIINIAKQ